MILKTSILAIVLLFVAVDGAGRRCKNISSGHFMHNSVLGNTRDFHYHVPSGTKKFHFRRGNCGSNYSWSPGSSIAIVKVHVRTNGTLSGRHQENWMVTACKS